MEESVEELVSKKTQTSSFWAEKAAFYTPYTNSVEKSALLASHANKHVCDNVHSEIKMCSSSSLSA